MKKLLPFLLLALLIALTSCSQSDHKSKQSDKKEDNKTTQNQSEDKSQNDSESSTDKSKSKSQNNNDDDKQANKIANAQIEAKKNAETYVDLAFSGKLGNEYKDNQDIFTQSMFQQLAKSNKQANKEDKSNQSVKDIKIYFNDDEEMPSKALYTATYKIIDHKNKNITQRNVTGEIDFQQENGKTKIDGSKIINTAENDDVNGYE